MQGFARDCRGSISLEFAITFPVLLILFCGIIEFTQLVRVNLELQNAAWTFANLVAMQGSIDDAGLADACAGSRLVMMPFGAAPLQISVASVTVSPTNAVKVDWQDGSCGGGAPVGSATAKAGALVSKPGDSVIIASASYTYVPILSYLLPASFALADVAYARPRVNHTIARN
jgi:Flp pilus assembly protein TadG